MSGISVAPPSWEGTAVGGVSPAAIVAQYTEWASVDRARATAVGGDLIRLAQAGDQVAPVMLVAIMGPYLRKRCRGFSLDDAISEFVEEVYRFNPDREEAQARNLAKRVMQQLIRQRERIERIDAVPTAFEHTNGDADDFVKLFRDSQLADDDKRLVFRIRVLDERIETIAAERGTATSTLYRHLARVEEGLVAQLQRAA